MRNIYLYIDWLQMEETAYPGILINIQHKLICKETLIAQMSEALKQVHIETDHKLF